MSSIGASVIADRLGEGLGGLHGEARQIERGEQARLAHRHGARRGVQDLLADPEILEEIADVIFDLLIGGGVNSFMWVRRV